MNCIIAGLIVVGAAAQGSSAVATPRTLPISFLRFDALHIASNGDTLAAEGFTGSRVFRIRPDGTTIVVADGLQGPIDVAEDDDGALYVTSFLDAKVRRIAPDGTVQAFAEVLPFPAGIVRVASGDFYVTHYGATDPKTGFGTGDTVLKISPDGEVSPFATGGALAAPVGIAIGTHGDLYVGNLHDGRVIALDRHGQQRVVADLTGPEVSFAIGHLAFAKGRIFATGLQDQALFRINPKNGRFRARDISARATFPNGIAFNEADGVLLIARGFSANPDLVKIQVRSHH